PIACAASLAVQKVIEGESLLARVREMGPRLAAMLGARFADHPHVGDVRGRGLFLAVELVRERASKEPFEPKRALHAAVKREAMARGLLVYPMGGTIDGERGDHVLLAPPFIVTEPDLAIIVDPAAAATDAAIAPSACPPCYPRRRARSPSFARRVGGRPPGRAPGDGGGVRVVHRGPHLGRAPLDPRCLRLLRGRRG